MTSLVVAAAASSEQQQQQQQQEAGSATNDNDDDEHVKLVPATFAAGDWHVAEGRLGCMRGVHRTVVAGRERPLPLPPLPSHDVRLAV